MVPPRPHPPTPSPIAPPSPGRGGATARKRLNLSVPRGFAGFPPLPVVVGRWERGPGGEVYGAGSPTQSWSDALLGLFTPLPLAGEGPGVRASSSMPEVPHPREQHRDPLLVGRGDDLVVALAAAGLGDRGDAGAGEGVQAVAEREEGVRGGGGAGERELGFLGREAAGVHPAHLAGADPYRLVAVGHHDRVRLRVAADLPGELQGPPLLGRRLPPGRTGPRCGIVRERVRRLGEEAAVDRP